MATFRLNSKIIPDEHKVWLVYSGKGRRYFQDFADNSCVFLALPGISPNSNIFSDPAKVRQTLRMSQAISEWIGGKTRNAPTRRLSAYSADPGDQKTKNGRRFNTLAGNVTRLFTAVRPGDLVISTAIGHYEPMLIGEVTSEWTPKDVLSLQKLQGETVPIRRVRWIRRDLSRRDFSPNVARTLQNRHAISEYHKDLYEEVYRAVYKNYIWGDRSKIDFLAPSYSGHDPLETYEGGFLIKYLVAAYSAKAKNKLNDFSKLPAAVAVDTYYDPSLVVEFQQNFNSPGQFSLVAGGALVAVVVGLGIAMATDQSSLADLLKNFQVVGGSYAIPGDEAVTARDEVKDLIDGIGRDRFEQEIKDVYGKKARQKLGMTSNITKN